MTCAPLPLHLPMLAISIAPTWPLFRTANPIGTRRGTLAKGRFHAYACNLNFVKANEVEVIFRQFPCIMIAFKAMSIQGFCSISTKIDSYHLVGQQGKQLTTSNRGNFTLIGTESYESTWQRTLLLNNLKIQSNFPSFTSTALLQLLIPTERILLFVLNSISRHYYTLRTITNQRQLI